MASIDSRSQALHVLSSSMSTSTDIATLPQSDSMETLNAIVAAVTAAVAAAIGPLIEQAVEAKVGSGATAIEAAAPKDLSDWLTVSEVADVLRCQRQRIYKMRCDGRIPDEQCRRDGSRLLISRDWLNTYLQEIAA